MCRAQGSCVCRIVHCEVEPNCATSVRRVRTVLLSKPLSEGPLKPSIYQCALICRKGILIRLAASQTMQNAQRLKESRWSFIHAHCFLCGDFEKIFTQPNLYIVHTEGILMNEFAKYHALFVCVCVFSRMLLSQLFLFACFKAFLKCGWSWLSST